MADAGEALARYYDLDLAEDQTDVEMYLALADASVGPVLELMAGTGRICVPLAAAGHTVVAVDRDQLALDRAAIKWAAPTHGAAIDRRGAARGSLELVNADITGLDLAKRFGLVIVALNSILLIDDRAAQQRLFATVAQHLAAGGRLVIDTWLPTPEDLAIYDGRLIFDWIRTDVETGDEVVKMTSARYEPATRSATLTSIFDATSADEGTRRTVRRDRVCFVSADELMAYAQAAGLAVETIAGDYDIGQFAVDSDRLVMVCRTGSG